MVKLKVFSDVTKHKVTESFLALHTLFSGVLSVLKFQNTN